SDIHALSSSECWHPKDLFQPLDYSSTGRIRCHCEEKPSSPDCCKRPARSSRRPELLRNIPARLRNGEIPLPETPDASTVRPKSELRPPRVFPVRALFAILNPQGPSTRPEIVL